MKIPYLLLLLLSTIVLILSCTKERSDNVTSFSDTNFTYIQASIKSAYSIDATVDGYIIAAGGSDINLVKLDQNFELDWERNFGSKPIAEKFDVEVLKNGGYVLAGSKQKSNPEGYAAHVIKTDEAGDAIWMRNYGVYSNAKARSIVNTSGGKIIFVGSDEYSGSNGSNYVVNYLNSEGDSYAKTDNDETVQDDAWSIVSAGNDEYAVLFSASNNRSKHTIGISKINSQSEVLWSKMFDEFQTTNKAYKIINTHDSGFVVCANVVNDDNSNSNILIFKVDGQGSLQWSHTYGGLENDIAHSVVQTSDKGFVIVGSTESYGIGKKDIYIVKTGRSGKLKWAKTYGSLHNDMAYDVQQAADKSLVICGESDQSMFVLHTDKTGSPE